MNNKAIAMIVAVSMVVVAMSGALAMGSSDAAADEDEIYTNGTSQVVSGEVTRELSVNEQEFAGYNYTLTWSVAALNDSSDTSDLDQKFWKTVLTSTNTVSPTGPSIRYTDNGSSSIGDSGSAFTVDVSHESDAAVGVYSLMVSGGSGTNYLGVKCEIKVTVGDAEKALASVYYIYTLSKVDAVDNSIQLEDMTMSEFTEFGSYVTEQSGKIGSIDGYYWYATGLPAGISMSENGYVSGVPLAPTTVAVEVNVVATDRTTGETFEGTLSITVNEHVETITGYYIELEIEGVGQGAVSNGDSFAAVQGETVTLKVYSGNSSAGTLTNATVTAIDEDNTVGAVSSQTTGVYSLDSDGTGAYRIVVTVGEEGSQSTLSFYLFVTPSLDNISAGIVVNGG